MAEALLAKRIPMSRNKTLEAMEDHQNPAPSGFTKTNKHRDIMMQINDTMSKY